MRIARNIAKTLVAGCALAALGTATAEAGSRDARDRPGYVVAESRYGGRVIAASVRRGPAGRMEVRLAAGTWIECGRSCSETLRRATIDFWDNQIRGGPDGPGYLRYRF